MSASRGTILALEWRGLRQLGLYESYLEAIDPARRDELLTPTPGMWVPADIMHLHYQTVDDMYLDPEDIRQIGWGVGNGAHGAFLGTLVRLAGTLGVTPWFPLKQANKLWSRSWRGGSVAVHRLEPQLAHLTFFDIGLCQYRYFRFSMEGVIAAAITPFCTKLDVRERTAAPTMASFRIEWTP